MKCPACKKARLKRLRTYIQDLRVRRENLCPKCGTRPVTIEMDEAAYLGELQELNGKIGELRNRLSNHDEILLSVRDHATELFSFLLPLGLTVVAAPKPQSSKKTVSRKKTSK